MRPLLLSVENLPAEGKTFSLEMSREDLQGLLVGADAGEVQVVAGLTGELRALVSGSDVFLLGRIRSRVAYHCARCLEEFEGEVEADFHRVYSSSEELETGEVELRREDLEVEPLQGGVIDLGLVVAEEVALVVKPYPVCRESCQGLCPVCGGNRNAGECRCEGRAADPRFAVLERLREKRKDEG